MLSVILILLKSITFSNINNTIHIKKAGYFINIKSIITYSKPAYYINAYLPNGNIVNILKCKPFSHLSFILICLAAKLY